jgi:hypothetical protein
MLLGCGDAVLRCCCAGSSARTSSEKTPGSRRIVLVGCQGGGRLLFLLVNGSYPSILPALPAGLLVLLRQSVTDSRYGVTVTFHFGTCGIMYIRSHSNLSPGGSFL